MGFLCHRDCSFSVKNKRECIQGGSRNPRRSCWTYLGQDQRCFQCGLKVMGGVIDAGYRGEIIMSMLNTLDKEVVLEKVIKWRRW